MNVFLNEKKLNNIRELLDDPGLNRAVRKWSKEGIFEKSAIDLKVFETPFGSINLLYGPRQIGKTSSLKQFVSRLTDSETIIFQDCSTIIDRRDLAQTLGKLIAGKTTIVLDEVQETSGWHLALRSLHGEGQLKNCRIWCTGSEARHLLESGERLPGRKGSYKSLYARPWSFREFIDFFYPQLGTEIRSIDYRHINQKWLDDCKLDLKTQWNSYLICGGIPAVVSDYIVDGEISDYSWQTYIDWILGTWSKLRTPERSLRETCKRIFKSINSRTSFDALRKSTDIQSANTIKSLLEMQEDHFALRLLTRYSVEQNRFLPAKQKKIYPLDPFIAQVFYLIGEHTLRKFSEKITPQILDRLNETGFLAQMNRYERMPSVGYLYHDKTKSEIDFFFDETGFELKSRGSPTSKQREILKKCTNAFVMRSQYLPIMAYLIGEGR